MNNRQIEIDFSDINNIRNVMAEYGNLGHMVHGQNDEGEDTVISINPDHIVLNTFQKNGWERENVYWEDGTVEETFKGRWK